MTIRVTFSSIFILCLYIMGFSQNVPIINYSVNNNGQAQLSFQGESDKYYLLHAQHNPSFNWAVAMSMGADGTMIISDIAGAYPEENYTITAHDIANPADYDGDGIDDVSEFTNMPTDSPLNFAEAIDFSDGTTSIPTAETFMDLATVNNVGWAPFLDDQLYVKFGILDLYSDEPQVYFINSNTHIIHAGFWDAIGANVFGDDGSGEIVFNPNVILPGGTVGTYSFNFSFGEALDFEATQRTYELLAASMPFLQNNLNHFIGEFYEDDHIDDYANDFIGSRIDVKLESDVFAEIDYIPFHEAEGYGFFRHMTNLNETPGSRDIVIYDALPNSLPRVGGIITSVVQTPLSHVNLRAIQDNVPNAYIKDPLLIDSIANLLGGYIYYKAENESFQIREATLDEVNDWYEELRPSEPQFPVRDLSIQNIRALDDIEFDMSTAFGAKCSNVATMRDFGFPDGTIPDGFGIPFYYYDEFMKFNNFYEEAQVMIDNPFFQTDINFRTDRLEKFRADIKDAPMPNWMMDALQAMHDAFPEGTSVRCRSSTNNEDLPGFSGAGLYTSKTQHPDEGHISKSIKQVYASMWNFRAYEERDFYRVDHFLAAMGVLCHPNFQNEKSNGVGISIDPIYETQNTFYLNTQVGESLITNPDPNSIPEEILLYEDPNQSGGYLVLRLSNLVPQGQLVMDQEYLDQMRDYLGVIHDEFAVLYEVEGAEGFAMDIEYKVTAEDQLIIKQARPWVSFWADITSDNDLGLEEIVSPVSSAVLGTNELVKVKVGNFGLNDMSDFDLELIVNGEVQEMLSIAEPIEPFSDAEIEFTVPQDFSSVGSYDITCVVSHPNDEYERNDTLNYVLNKIPSLDAKLSIVSLSGLCDEQMGVNALVSNLGANTITEVELQVTVNGQVIDVVEESVTISSQDQTLISITIDENLQEFDNDVLLTLLSVNEQTDEVVSNNTASESADLESSYGIVTLAIKADNYPFETTWEVIDNRTNQILASGGVNGAGEVFTEDICLDLSSCFSLNVYDSFGDGICCAYGEGSFQVLDADGNQILFNDGQFSSKVTEFFCPDGTGCAVNASVDVTHVSNDFGAISIYANAGYGPYEYSIDGGSTFQNSNSFINLVPGDYEVVINGFAGVCSYEETVTIENCTTIAVEIESSNASNVLSADGYIVISPLAGSGPYQYSLDGGQYFVDENEFYNLPVGNYNVIVQDLDMICTYETTVAIESNFDEQIVDSDIIINEINYNSPDDVNPGDWVELYNASDSDIDLSGWIMKDNDDSHSFELPQGTVIAGLGFLILTREEALFLEIYPDLVDIVVGDFDFGLSSNGDAVRLYNTDGDLVDAVTYLSESPWPTEANGEGYTLELYMPDFDNGVVDNWYIMNLNGSPGRPNIMVSTDNMSDGDYKITCYPNPANDEITITMDSSSEWTEDVLIEVYDNIGKKIQDGFITRNGDGSTNISLAGQASGTYLVRCFNNTFVRSFVVVKL